MRKLVTVFAVAVLFACRSTVQAYGPVGPSPTQTDLLAIVSIFANNSGTFQAQVQCKSTTSVVASYRISVQSGGSSVTLKNGTVTVSKNHSAPLSATFQRTKGPQTLRLDVSSTAPKASASRSVSVSTSKLYVIAYRTNGWVQVAYQFQKTTTELIGTKVEKPAAECRALGFKTRTRRSHTTVVFGTDSYRTYADARLDQFIEKTFNSAAERDEFKRALYKLVPPFQNDGAGLYSRESERDLTLQK